MFQCLNQLFQCTNISIRNQFIQIFTPLLLNELKKLTNNPQQQYIIEILKIFETLLAVVDSSLRMFDIHLFKLINLNLFRYSFGIINHSIIYKFSSQFYHISFENERTFNVLHHRTYTIFNSYLFKRISSYSSNST